MIVIWILCLPQWHSYTHKLPYYAHLNQQCRHEALLGDRGHAPLSFVGKNYQMHLHIVHVPTGTT